MSIRILSPRAPFQVVIGSEPFLCYRTKVDPSEAEIAMARAIWSAIGKPNLILVDEPISGAPLYRPSAETIANLPILDPDSDPGVCIGALDKATLEAVKQISSETKAELEALANEAFERPYEALEDGRIRARHVVSAELPTWIGERATWTIGHSLSAVCVLSAEMEALGVPFKTYDLNLEDEKTARSIAERRAKEARKWRYRE